MILSNTPLFISFILALVLAFVNQERKYLLFKSIIFFNLFLYSELLIFSGAMGGDLEQYNAVCLRATDFVLFRKEPLYALLMWLSNKLSCELFFYRHLLSFLLIFAWWLLSVKCYRGVGSLIVAAVFVILPFLVTGFIKQGYAVSMMVFYIFTVSAYKRFLLVLLSILLHAGTLLFFAPYLVYKVIFDIFRFKNYIAFLFGFFSYFGLVLISSVYDIYYFDMESEFYFLFLLFYLIPIFTLDVLKICGVALRDYLFLLGIVIGAGFWVSTGFGFRISLFVFCFYLYLLGNASLSSRLFNTIFCSKVFLLFFWLVICFYVTGKDWFLF